MRLETRIFTDTWKYWFTSYVRYDIIDIKADMPDKPLIWLRGEVKTPPFSAEARIRAGYLLRELQSGKKLALPDSRPMPELGLACQELRVYDSESRKTWRIMYRVYSDAILILDVFAKKTNKTPKEILQVCRQRLTKYESALAQRKHETK